MNSTLPRSVPKYELCSKHHNPPAIIEVIKDGIVKVVIEFCFIKVIINYQQASKSNLLFKILYVFRILIVNFSWINFQGFITLI